MFSNSEYIFIHFQRPLIKISIYIFKNQYVIGYQENFTPFKNTRTVFQLMLWLYPIQVEINDKKGLENTLLADLKHFCRTLGSKRRLKEKSQTVWKAKTKTLHTKAYGVELTKFRSTQS